MLAWDAEAGKVNFEFAPSKFPPRKTAATPLTKAAVAAKSGAASATSTRATTSKASKAAKTPAKKVVKAATPKAPRKAPAAGAAGSTPSAALAAVIGAEPVSRPQAIKKLWEYIKAHNLQDPKDKRTIVADDKLLAVLGQPSVGMFALTGLVGKHLS
jgi:DNA topoisomerase-3